MVKVKILSARCENFKGFKAFETNFANQTLICGRNGIGKSSIAELIMWVLFGVGNDLSNNPKVRHEVDQKTVNDVPVIGELTLDVDGVEVVARKVQKRTFKKDGSYSDDNTYSINGVEKNLKDFNAYFGFSFNDLLMCMNIGAFLSQKPKEMREFLFKLPQSLSAEDVIAKYPELFGLKEFIGKYSIEEIAAMNKASITKLNKEIAGYPARIDEVNRQIVDDSNASELELQKKVLEEQIEEIENQEEDSVARTKEWDVMNQDLMELQFKKSDIEKHANSTLIEQRGELQRVIDTADTDFRKAMTDQRMAELDIERITGAIERQKEEKEHLIRKFNEVRQKEYPNFEPFPPLEEDAKFCPACGQVLPEEKLKELLIDYAERAEKHAEHYKADQKAFEELRNKRLEEIAFNGNNCKKKLDELEVQLEEAEKRKNKAVDVKMQKNREKNEAVSKLNELPERADLSDNQEYEALIDEIRKKEEAIRSLDNGADYRSVLKHKKAGLQDDLDNVKNQLARIIKNVELEERIEFLRSEHTQKEQVKADCERILDLLDELDKKRNELLSDDINAHFGGRVTWDLFAFAKNGGYKKDYCVPKIDGYTLNDNTANHGRVIEAMLIIALSVQKILGIQAPIILDDGESLDPWRIPETDNQLIIMSRTDDPELKVMNR